MREEYKAFADGFEDRVSHKEPRDLSEFHGQAEARAYALGYRQGGHVNDPDPKESRAKGVLVVVHRKRHR